MQTHDVSMAGECPVCSTFLHRDDHGLTCPKCDWHEGKGWDVGEIAKGFKVLKTPRGSVYGRSAAISSIYAVNYLPGHWAEPHNRCGPLAVFTRLISALNFRDENFFTTTMQRDISLWTCEYVPATGMEMWIPSVAFNDSRRVRSLNYAPIGTRLAEKVRVLEEIE